jgi:hypothetical protein
VGVLASKGGKQKAEKGSISLVELAAIHEFGSPAAGIPERSFLRAPLRGDNRTISALMKKLAKAVVDGRLTHKKALEILGQAGVSEVNKYVRQGANLKPLKPATIARKKSSRPLIDTGRMLQAVSYEVSDG